MSLNKNELQSLLSNVQPVDNSNVIQNKKHSTIIKDDIQKLLKIKKEHSNLTHEELDNLCSKECFFLFKNYTQIYNLFLKKDLNVNIFNELLENLQKIENGDLNQHEASIKVGQLLKTIYIDNAMKERKDDEEKIEKENQQLRDKQLKNIKDISWNQYKNKYNEISNKLKEL